MKIQIAKKDHICDLCLGKISKGERYWRGFTEGELVFPRKEHTNCEKDKDDEK